MAKQTSQPFGRKYDGKGEKDMTKKDQMTEQTKRFPLKLRVYMKPYEMDGKSGTSVTAELIDPFPEYAEDYNNVRIAPRWDRDVSVFKFRMKVYLKTHDDIILDGYCEPVGFASKKPDAAGEMVYYPGIFFSVPYAGEPIEFGFKKRPGTDKDGNNVFTESSDFYIFRDLVSEKWGGSYEPVRCDTADDLLEAYGNA